MVFRQKGRAVYALKVPKSDGSWRTCSTGTKHARTARRIEQMVQALGPQGERAWDLLDRVHAGSITLADLFDRYTSVGQDLGQLRRALSETDLEPMVEQFLSAATCSDDTKAHYRVHLHRLMPEDVRFPIEQFTRERIQKVVDEMKGTAATRRKCGAAIRSFGNWLVDRGHLEMNPARLVRLPRPAAPRTLFLDVDDAVRLAEAQPSPYREFSALLAGSGIEVSVALTLRRRDVDTDAKEIRARGTKTHARDRVVRVADWAWPYVQRLVKGKTPDALLFADIPDRWEAGEVHRAVVKALEEEHPIFAGYTMRDARHSYAVRAIRAGTPADIVARQLGHANPTLVLQVYGRFQPSQDERSKWERIATAVDTARRKAAKETK